MKNEIPRDPISGNPLKAGDLLLVLRKGEQEENAGMVDSIDPRGTVWINYGGYVTPLYDHEQIRVPPDEIHEALALSLQQRNEEVKKSLQEMLAPLVRDIQAYDTSIGPFGWLRNFFKRTV